MESFKIEDLPIKIKRNAIQRIFSKIQPDDIIDKLISRSDLSGPPTDLFRICHDLDLKLYEEDLHTDGYLVESPDGKGIIFYKGPKYLKGFRWRFTIAHEVAHWVLERMTDERNSYQTTLEKIEDWCNDFAGRLLIPNQWLKMAVKQELTNLDQYLGLIKTFEVSEEVLVRRLWEVLRISIISGVWSEGKLIIKAKWPRNTIIQNNELQKVSRLFEGAHGSQGSVYDSAHLLIGPIVLYSASATMQRYYIISCMQSY